MKQGKEVVPSKPTIIGIEITNACSLNCLGCPRHRMSRKIDYMKEEVFREAIKQVASIQDFVWLHFFGDPLLHKDLTKFIKLAHQEGVKVGISTKGNLLQGDICEKIIECELDHLWISWYGLDKDSIETASGFKYEEVSRNILNFIKLKRSKKVDKPRITLEFLIKPVTKDNFILQKKRFKYMKRTFKVDNYHIKILHTWAGDDEGVLKFLSTSRQKLSKSPCFSLWKGELNILVNGDVVPCCADYDGKYVLGNIMEEKIEKIWNNERMRKLRKFHINGKRGELELCKSCSLSEEWSGLLAMMREKFVNLLFAI